MGKARNYFLMPIIDYWLIMKIFHKCGVLSISVTLMELMLINTKEIVL